MYIPYIVFIIILTGLAFWFDKQKRDARKEFDEAIHAERQAARERSEQDFNRYYSEKEELYTYIVSTVYDVCYTEAQDKYQILKRTNNVYDFVYARSNSQRKKIYEQALADFNNMTESEILQ